MRSEPQDMALAVDVQTPKLPCLTRFIHLMFESKQMLLNELNQAKSASWWHVQLIVHVTTRLLCTVISGIRVKENA